MKLTAACSIAAFLSMPVLPAGAQQPDWSSAKSLSIDDYENLALEQGTQGLLAIINMKTADYARYVAFRQTDSPSLTANFTGNLTETKTYMPPAPYSLSRTRTYDENLTLTEPLPTGAVLTLTGANTQTNSWSSGGAPNSSGQPTYSAAAVQPVYLFVQNAIWRNRKRAALQFSNAQDTFEQQKLAIRVQARGLYYAVMQQSQAVDVAKRKVDGSRVLLGVVRALVDAGRAAPVEATRSRIQLESDERDLQNTQLSLDQAVLNAKNFISIPVDQTVRFTSSLGFKPMTVSLDRLTRYALERNQGLIIQRRNLQLADYDLAQAKEADRPILSLNGGYTRGVGTREWNAGGTASWLLFDSFITKTNVGSSALARRAVALNIAETERSLASQVKSAYLAVMNSETQVRDFKTSRQQAAQNIEVVRARFQSGLDRLLDVFDAETQAHDLDLQYLNLLLSHQQSKDALAQLVGAPLEVIP